MTELVLVRHGETVWHADNRYAGRSDVELTDRGHDQGAQLARWAADAGLDAVLTSPLRRAHETAVPAARAAGLTCRVDPRLVEVDFGKGDGLTRDEMREAFPDALEAFVACPASHPLPQGEAGEAAVARALPVLREAAAEHPGRPGPRRRPPVAAAPAPLRAAGDPARPLPHGLPAAGERRPHRRAPRRRRPPALLALNVRCD